MYVHTVDLIHSIPYFDQVNLVDLSILCSLRIMTHALIKLKDQYLVSNCCAILVNLSQYIDAAHPGMAERVVHISLLVSNKVASRLLVTDV